MSDDFLLGRDPAGRLLRTPDNRLSPCPCPPAPCLNCSIGTVRNTRVLVFSGVMPCDFCFDSTGGHRSYHMLRDLNGTYIVTQTQAYSCRWEWVSPTDDYAREDRHQTAAGWDPCVGAVYESHYLGLTVRLRAILSGSTVGWRVQMILAGAALAFDAYLPLGVGTFDCAAPFGPLANGYTECYPVSWLAHGYGGYVTSPA